jgi:alpha-beta hydrolase superfamily lysophospholipase
MPVSQPRAGVLLLHGMSDSPYSLRKMAERLHQAGAYVVGLRIPGHGTAPSGLTRVTWQDMAAAVKIAVQHLAEKSNGQPMHMVGYSNGGALAVNYTLEALVDGEPVPDRLFLFSPAIGITGFARAAWWASLYSFIPYFEKSRWMGIQIEFDPYKYNSFTNNAGTQSWQLANEIQVRLAKVKKKGLVDKTPPILAFQSIVDATVQAEVLVSGLFDHLESKGNEVVFFDINRSEKLESFLSLKFAKKLDFMMAETNLKYTVTKVSNRDSETHEMSARSRLPGVAKVAVYPLELNWPRAVYSLAHVAIPFPENDPLYGQVAPDPAVYGIHIGSFHPIGEKHVFEVPPSQLIRIRHNPFHAYMNERMLEVIGKDSETN